jgi:anti-sigma regulatory factor (Ser/Thr protein kinase)
MRRHWQRKVQDAAMARKTSKTSPHPLMQLTQWITEAAASNGDQLPTLLMTRLEVSRRTALALLRKLCDMQWLTALGSPRKRRYQPGPLRQVVRRYALAGLQEDLPWRLDFAPFFVLPPEVKRMAQHAFTELLNNAIDHSGGSTVTVSMRQTPTQMQLLVSDDGCGVFERIGSCFDITDPRLAMLELSKGKLTSLPDRHSGHGLFFTSRLADVFDIHANQAAFQCRAWDPQRWLAGKPSSRSGSSVYCAIALDTPRTLDSVLRAHSANGLGHAFERTHVPLQLLCSDGAALISRADAKRVAARLADFKVAELDFSGISEIGHGFADELFRVARTNHAGTKLLPVGLGDRLVQQLRQWLPEDRAAAAV